MEIKMPQTNNKQSAPQTPPKRPNETGSVAIMGHLKIFDPNTKEVKLETRE